MTLVDMQKTVCAALRELPYLNGVPVLVEEEGNVVAERDAAFAKTHLAVIAGAAGFTPTSRDCRIITGIARLTVTVFEQPSRNRIGQTRYGPTVTGAAEAIACAMQLLAYNGGVLVMTGIGGIERIDDKTIARTVNLETLATLTGE